jgi:hypothetical protein
MTPAERATLKLYRSYMTYQIRRGDRPGQAVYDDTVDSTKEIAVMWEGATDSVLVPIESIKLDFSHGQTRAFWLFCLFEGLSHKRRSKLVKVLESKRQELFVATDKEGDSRRIEFGFWSLAQGALLQWSANPDRGFDLQLWNQFVNDITTLTVTP